MFQQNAVKIGQITEKERLDGIGPVRRFLPGNVVK